MANYKILTGPFAGEVAEEGQLLDVSFTELDDDLQQRIKDFAEGHYDLADPRPEDLDTMKDDYENSWDVEETEEEEPTIKPVSEWL